MIQDLYFNSMDLASMSNTDKIKLLFRYSTVENEASFCISFYISFTKL